MKKIVLVLALLVPVLSFGQSLTSTYVPPDGAVSYTFYLSAMADSTGSYYSAPIGMYKFNNVPFTTIPFTGEVKTSSTAGACSVHVVIQGRYVNGATVGDWVDLDTVNASGTETSQLFSEDLGGYFPDQIRIHADGLSGNRADAVIRVFFTLTPRSYYMIKF